MSLLDHFKPATKEEVIQQQQQQILISPVKHQEIKPVGRPKKPIVVELNRTASESSINTDNCTNKRKYTNWITSPFVHDIIEAVRLCKSFRKAVKYLQNKHRKLPTEQHGRLVLVIGDDLPLLLG